MIEKLLGLFSPERAHAIAKWGMKHKLCAPGVLIECRNDKQTLFGTAIKNPLGLAAGFDKNGDLVDVIEEYGFGFVEVGSVTYRGGPGNPKPRLFRLAEESNPHGIMNRMGLNGDPAEIVAGRLLRATSDAFGVNIAKTHSPEIMGDAAIRDIQQTYKLVRNLGAYTALNISCPNTREGKTFEEPSALRELLVAIGDTEPSMHHYRLTPLLVKMSPTLVNDATRLDGLIKVCRDHNISGYVMCNTLPMDHPQHGKGGGSGTWVKQRATILIQWMRQIHKVTEPIIACGGIFSGQDLIDYETSGATFFQNYNGFVRGPNAGPKFARAVLDGAEFIRNPPVFLEQFRDDELEQTSLGQDMRGKTSLD